MMLPREKVQVGTAFLGLFLIGFGLALVQPGKSKEDIPTPNRPQGVGFWKDHALGVAAGRKIGSWMIGGGVVAIGVAFVIRQR